MPIAKLSKLSPLDELGADFFPPFTGFPKEGLVFLQKLKKNNRRDWFQPRKDQFDTLLKFPMQCLVATLGEKLRRDAPEFSYDPKKALFRIYRDTRFSKLKIPYKTNVGASLDVKSDKPRGEQISFYMHIEPEGVFAGGGLYMLTPDQLKAVRASIIDDPETYLEVVEDAAFKKMFKRIEGEKLKTAPKGIAKDHPMLEHLQHKQFFVSKPFTDAAIHKAKFADDLAHVFRTMLPLMRWLHHIAD